LTWSDIILEGYCISGPEKKVRPKYCKKKPTIICLMNKCNYFGYCNGEKDLYFWINEFYNKEFDEKKLKKIWEKHKLI